MVILRHVCRARACNPDKPVGSTSSAGCAHRGRAGFVAVCRFRCGVSGVWRRVRRRPSESSIGPVIVSPPPRKPEHGCRRNAARPDARACRRPPSRAGRSCSGCDRRTGRLAKLRSNTNVVTEVGSRLGLTVRQTPATVEVIDKQVIEDRGLRTTTDLAKAAVGVIGGDAPGAPAIFSMRGFSGDQINTLYNDIWIGPSTMTGRPMDTANLERVEILKGPSSLLSGIGATGGAVNYVTKAPHTGRDRQRSLRRLQFVQRLPGRIWLRRQHTGRRAGLSLRHHPFEQCRLHRRYLFQAQQRFGPTELSRHR